MVERVGGSGVSRMLTRCCPNVGSGDIFAGAVVAEVSRGGTLEEAASLAAAATSAVLATRDTVAPPDLRELADEVMRATESRRAFDWRWRC